MLNNKDLVMAITLVLLVLAPINGAENDNDDSKLQQCEKSFIRVTQGTIGAMPSGTPIYSVQVTNECPTKCKIAKIHLSCGLFRSDKLILPNEFRLVAANDCLVNNGQPIQFGAVLSFEYANSHPFPLGVSSVQCL